MFNHSYCAYSLQILLATASTDGKCRIFSTYIKVVDAKYVTYRCREAFIVGSPFLMLILLHIIIMLIGNSQGIKNRLIFRCKVWRGAKSFLVNRVFFLINNLSLYM